MIDVVCVSLTDKDPIGLDYLPEHRVIRDSSPGWSVAANAALDRTENDVLFIDDDVELYPWTLDLVHAYYDKAEVFGVTLLGPGPAHAMIQSSGHVFVYNKNTDEVVMSGLDLNLKAMLSIGYIAHVTTCCVYIKKEVIKAGVRFQNWDDGLHYEDIIFCMDAWLHGYRVMRTPATAFHHGMPNGAGSVKGIVPNFIARREINRLRMIEWFKNNHVKDAVRAGTIPLGVKACPITR